MPDGNNLQNSAVLASVADAAIARFAEVRSEGRVPSWVKWVGGGLGTIFSGSVLALGVWLFGSVSDMKETLGRMDERQIAQANLQDTRLADFDRRLTRVEAGQGMRRGSEQ